MPHARPPYGLLAEFDNPQALLEAVRQTHAAGYRHLDAYSPFPVEGLADALGFRRTRMPLVIFVGGLTGCLAGYLMQYWCNAVDYPINVGGRPLNSWPMFLPVTFELTVLFAALAGVFGLLALCGLPMPYHPLFNVPDFAGATRDRFFLCIEQADPLFDPGATRQFLAGLHPRGDVVEVHWR
jgi:hypothetical protein